MTNRTQEVSVLLDVAGAMLRGKRLVGSDADGLWSPNRA